MKTVKLNKSAMVDLVCLREESESLELIENAEFMDSYKRSRKQIKERDFADWNAL